MNSLLSDIIKDFPIDKSIITHSTVNSLIIDKFNMELIKYNSMQCTVLYSGGYKNEGTTYEFIQEGKNIRVVFTGYENKYGKGEIRNFLGDSIPSSLITVVEMKMQVRYF